MCGIIGFVGEVPEGKWIETYDILNALFLAAEPRGIDATGFVAMCQHNKRRACDGHGRNNGRQPH